MTAGKHLMRAPFDFLFGKPLGDAETALTLLKSRSLWGRGTPRVGLPSLSAEELGLPGTY